MRRSCRAGRLVSETRAAQQEPNAVDPQTAFELAGGAEAWLAIFEAASKAGAGTAGAAEQPCANVPVTP